MFSSYVTNSSHIHLPSPPRQHFVHLKNKTRPIKTNLFCLNILGCVTFHWSIVNTSGATWEVGHEVPHLVRNYWHLTSCSGKESQLSVRDLNLRWVTEFQSEQSGSLEIRLSISLEKAAYLMSHSIQKVILLI